MTKTQSIRVPATDVREGDNLWLGDDTGVRITHTVRVRGWVELHSRVGMQRRVRPSAEVRLHGRDVAPDSGRRVISGGNL